MNIRRTLAASAIALGIAFAANAASSASYEVDFSGSDARGAVTAQMFLNVVGGQVISGTGSITTGVQGSEGWGTAGMTFLSSPTLSTTYRFSGGTDLFQDDNAFPIDGNGIVFNVGTPVQDGFRQTGGGFAIWSVGGDNYQAGLFDFVNGGHEYEVIGGSATVSAVPLPAALPLFGAAVVGLGWYGRRRAKKATAAA